MEGAATMVSASVIFNKKTSRAQKTPCQSGCGATNLDQQGAWTSLWQMRVRALREQVQEQRVYAVDFRSGDNITAMPRDIMVKIFSRLGPLDVPVLSLVCKQWKRSTTEPALWRHYSLQRWAAKIQWSIVDEITEDFLEEYGWLRLYRNIIELDKHEAAMLAENEELEANTIEIRKRLSEQQQAVERSVSKLKALTSAQRKDIADLGCTPSSEAVGCAVMILQRREPTWAEVIRNAQEDTLVSKVEQCDHQKFTPGMQHRVSRLSARPDFQAVANASEDTGECEALRLLALWVVACESYCATARQLAPKEELVQRCLKSLPERIEGYKKARAEIEELIGAGCFIAPPQTPRERR